MLSQFSLKKHAVGRSYDFEKEQDVNVSTNRRYNQGSKSVIFKIYIRDICKTQDNIEKNIGGYVFSIEKT